MTEVVTLNGKHIAKISAKVGSKLFVDDFKKIYKMPKLLYGSNMFQLSWHDTNNSSISVTCERKCVVIVAIWEHKNRVDSLMNSYQSDNWMSEEGEKMKLVLNNGNKNGYTKYVLSKTIQANETLSFINPRDGLPISVFVEQGK